MRLILFRYIGREILVSMVSVTFVLLVIIMSGRFVKYLAQVAEGDFAAHILFQIMAYRLPSFMEIILPLGFYVGILLAYGRLYVENEMSVMQACGMSRLRLISYTMAPAMVVMVLVAYTSLLLSPSGVKASRQVIEVSQSSSALKIALEGRFRVDDSGWVTYIESVQNGSEMENIFLARSIVEADGRNRVELIGADNGRLSEDQDTGERVLHMDNGVRKLGTPGELDYQFLRFNQLDMTMPAARLPEQRARVDGKSSMTLWQEGGPESIAALQWRVSLALLVPVVTLLGIAFSKTNPRQGRYTKLFPAFLVFLIYLVVLNAARDAVAKGNLPLWPGLGWVHLGFLSLALFMLYGEDIKKRLLPAPKQVIPAGGEQ